MLYPTQPLPQMPYPNMFEWQTVMFGPVESGKSVARVARKYGLYRAKLNYAKKDIATVNSLYDFVASVYGKAFLFNFRDFQGWDLTPVGIPWRYQYVGVSDGVQPSMVLPSYGANAGGPSSRTLYYNRIPKVEGTHWTFGNGTGNADLADKATFIIGPSLGQIVEFDFTGQLQVQARLDSDQMPLNTFITYLRQTGLGIIQEP